MLTKATGYEQTEKTAQKETEVKPVTNPYEGMNQEELEKVKEAMDEYDLNLDFF